MLWLFFKSSHIDTYFLVLIAKYLVHTFISSTGTPDVYSVHFQNTTLPEKFSNVFPVFQIQLYLHSKTLKV